MYLKQYLIKRKLLLVNKIHFSFKFSAKREMFFKHLTIKVFPTFPKYLITCFCRKSACREEIN